MDLLLALNLQKCILHVLLKSYYAAFNGHRYRELSLYWKKSLIVKLMIGVNQRQPWSLWWRLGVGAASIVVGYTRWLPYGKMQQV